MKNTDEGKVVAPVGILNRCHPVLIVKKRPALVVVLASLLLGVMRAMSGSALSPTLTCTELR